MRHRSLDAWANAPLIVALAFSLGAAPPKKKPESKVRQAATKRAAELVSTLSKQKVSGFVALGRSAFPSKETALASKEPGAGALAVDTSSLRGGRGGTLWKVVADHGDVVDLQSLPSSTGHCHGPSAGDPIEIRAVARKIDLVPMLATEQSERLKDGTTISFAPGAAVGAPIFPRRGGWAVYAGGINFELKVHEKAITLGYAAPKTFTFQRRRNGGGLGVDGKWEPPSFRQMSEAAVFYLDGAAALRGSDLPEDLQEVQASEAGPRAGQELLELASACVRLKVLGTSEDGDNRSGGVGGLGGRNRPTFYRIPKGTALTYPDGSAAGKTLEEMRRQGPSTDKGRLCFRFNVAIEGPLCALASVVEEEK